MITTTIYMTTLLFTSFKCEHLLDISDYWIQMIGGHYGLTFFITEFPIFEARTRTLLSYRPTLVVGVSQSFPKNLPKMWVDALLLFGCSPQITVKEKQKQTAQKRKKKQKQIQIYWDTFPPKKEGRGKWVAKRAKKIKRLSFLFLSSLGLNSCVRNESDQQCSLTKWRSLWSWLWWLWDVHQNWVSINCPNIAKLIDILYSHVLGPFCDSHLQFLFSPLQEVSHFSCGSHWFSLSLHHSFWTSINRPTIVLLFHNHQCSFHTINVALSRILLTFFLFLDHYRAPSLFNFSFFFYLV